MLWTSLQTAVSILLRHRLALVTLPKTSFSAPNAVFALHPLTLCPDCRFVVDNDDQALQGENNNTDQNDSLFGNPFWFAVPKSKHTKSRKRMKTTAQKRLKLKKNIVFDPRTGEVTLKHKLPFNWKEYLPKVE